MQEFRVAKLKDLKKEGGFLARVAGEEIALFTVEGEVFAIANVCTHQHFSKLHEGELSGYVVTCPMHGWSYDIRTGISTNASGKVKSYEVAVRGEEVFVRKNGDADSTN